MLCQLDALVVVVVVVVVVMVVVVVAAIVVVVVVVVYIHRGMDQDLSPMDPYGTTDISICLRLTINVWDPQF